MHAMLSKYINSMIFYTSLYLLQQIYIYLERFYNKMCVHVQNPVLG
jgi:hypothetical protein